MIKQKILASALLTGFLAAGSAEAATIASFDFSDGLNATITAPELTVSTSLTTGAGISGSDTSGGLLAIDGSQTSVSVNAANLNAALAPAITQNTFVSFTIDISAEQSVDLTSISYGYEANNGFDFAIGVFSSLTGFTTASNLLDGEFLNGDNDFSRSGPVDLTANTAFENLTDTSVEFRFYFGDGSSATTRVHELDNILLEGDITTVAVPEPSSAALLGLGGLALILRRRK